MLTDWICLLQGITWHDQVHQHSSDLYCEPGKMWLLKIRSCHHPIPPIDAYNNSLCTLTHIFLVANQSACHRMSFMRHAMLLAFAFQGGFGLPQVLLTPQQAVLIPAYLSIWVEVIFRGNSMYTVVPKGLLEWFHMISLICILYVPCTHLEDGGKTSFRFGSFLSESEKLKLRINTGWLHTIEGIRKFNNVSNTWNNLQNLSILDHCEIVYCDI